LWHWHITSTPIDVSKKNLNLYSRGESLVDYRLLLGQLPFLARFREVSDKLKLGDKFRKLVDKFRKLGDKFRKLVDKLKKLSNKLKLGDKSQNCSDKSRDCSDKSIWTLSN